MAWFSDKVTKEDVKLFRHKVGDSAGQQIWECLVVLIALKVWTDFWLPRKTAITIRSDNYSALAMTARLKVPSSANIIGREVALIYSQACFEPRFVDHVPGATNVLSDDLSRLADSSSPHEMPALLMNIKPTWYQDALVLGIAACPRSRGEYGTGTRFSITRSGPASELTCQSKK